MISVKNYDFLVTLEQKLSARGQPKAGEFVYGNWGLNLFLEFSLKRYKESQN